MLKIVQIIFSSGAEKILGADYAKTLRFGVRMAFASGEERTQKSEELQLEKIRSLDDEHCPGVFKVRYWSFFLYRALTPCVRLFVI